MDRIDMTSRKTKVISDYVVLGFTKKSRGGKREEWSGERRQLVFLSAEDAVIAYIGSCNPGPCYTYKPNMCNTILVCTMLFFFSSYHALF